MLTNRNVERLAGGLLAGGVVVFMSHVVTFFVLDAKSVTILLVLLYGLMIFLSAAATYMTFGRHDRALALFSATGFAAHGMLIVIACSLILTYFQLGDEFPVAAGAEGGPAAAAKSAIELTMDMIRTFAFVFMGLGLIPLGLLIIWSGVVARWVGWLGLGCGILGLLAALFDFVGGFDSIMFGISFVSTFAFLVILGVRLLVRETRAPAHEVPRRRGPTYRRAFDSTIGS